MFLVVEIVHLECSDYLLNFAMKESSPDIHALMWEYLL